MDANLRDRLYNLVDCLPDAEVRAAERYLQYLTVHGDPLTKAALTAPEDEDELSESGRRLLNEGCEDLAAGRTHTLDEVKRETAVP